MKFESWAAGFLAAACIAAPGAARAAVSEGVAGALQNRTIGYVMTSENKAVYQTPDGKDECANGFNDGPREQFKILFPDDGAKRKLIDTQLEREGQIWFPSTTREPYAFKEAGGRIAIGLNLDGKVGSNDFTSPDGEKGIDNQLYRAIGCIVNYRNDGETSIVTPRWRGFSFNIFLMELTGVDSLTNDDDVTVTTYRGLDKLITDATGATFLPGGTQRIDGRWGRQFVQRFHGKIVDGTLITEPADLTMPAAGFDGTSSILFRGMRFRVKLTPNGGEGLMGGYADIESWYTDSNTTRSTHHQSYGQQSAPSLYRALHRLADGYPDPKTGENTAISSALEARFTQVFIKHPAPEVALKTGDAPVHAAAKTGTVTDSGR